MYLGLFVCDTNRKESHPRTVFQTQAETWGSPGKPNAHLRHDFDLLVPTLEGQGEDLSAPIGHGGRLAVHHEVHAVGLRRGWLGVLLGTDHVEGLRIERRGRGEEGVRRQQAQSWPHPPQTPPGLTTGPCRAPILSNQVTSDHSVSGGKHRSFKESHGDEQGIYCLIVHLFYPSI